MPDMKPSEENLGYRGAGETARWIA
jgi:hypothetical protein